MKIIDPAELFEFCESLTCCIPVAPVYASNTGTHILMNAIINLATLIIGESSETDTSGLAPLFETDAILIMIIIALRVE